ncbi:MAG: hypothetical protein DVB23_001333 [Verrucomicrobia bacterium]|nr:MAG: hypothetical protein DVB23_001333 [Verrucomicrobiota bacterium]
MKNTHFGAVCACLFVLSMQPVLAAETVPAPAATSSAQVEPSSAPVGGVRKVGRFFKGAAKVVGTGLKKTGQAVGRAANKAGKGIGKMLGKEGSDVAAPAPVQ